MAAVTEPLRLMQIEKDLAGPDKLEAMRRYDETLAKLQRRLGEAMKQGLAPDEFEQAKRLDEATTTARKILRLTVRVDG